MGTGTRPLSPQELGKRQESGDFMREPGSNPSHLLQSPNLLREGWLPSSAVASASSGKLGEHRDQRRPWSVGSLCKCRLRGPSTEREAGSPGRGLQAPR